MKSIKKELVQLSVGTTIVAIVLQQIVEYKITIVCKDGKVDVKSDEGISVDLKQK